MEHNCKICLYYDIENNLCDGFTYKCECLTDFCPMYETEEMLQRRKELSKETDCRKIKRKLK